MRGIRSIGGIVLVLALVGVRYWSRSNRKEKPPPTQRPVVRIAEDPEIETLSARAREKLIRDIGPLWTSGRPDGEALHVKSPFATPEGSKEFIWLEVQSWSGNDIRGKLVNQPESVPGLNLGAEVTVQADQVFDYVRSLKDGSEEGNETEELIMKRSMKK